MTPREREIFRVAVELAKDLDDCNPDVGMGPSWNRLARRVAGKLSFGVSDVEIADTVIALELKHRR